MKDRAEVIRLSAHGWYVEKIAAHFNWTTQTVREVLHRWEHLGLEGLWEKPGRGGKSRWAEADMVFLEECLEPRLNPDSIWSNFNSVGMVESVRSFNGETTVETRYFISSLESDAKQFGNSIRSHWGIENSLHWLLDVALREDDCRIRKDNAPHNFAILRHIAVNLLTQEKRVKRGIKNKQFLAAMDNKYLLSILALA